MASIVTTNQVLTTSGVPFEGVLRVFPNGSAPLFGAVLHYEFVNGFITNTLPSPAPTFADDEYCFQWMHFATLSTASTIPQICEYVATVTGVQEVTALQTEMLSYYSYISALAQCRTDLMLLMDQVTSLETQLQSCQDTAAANQQIILDQFNECASDLADSQTLNDQLQSELMAKDEALAMCQESLQNALAIIEQLTTEQEIQEMEEEIRAQMMELRKGSTGTVAIRVPSCSPASSENPEETQKLMQRMAGYGTAAVSAKVNNSSSAATAAATLRAEREQLQTRLAGIGKRYKQPVPCRTMNPNVVNPAPVVPEDAPSVEAVNDVRARIEAMKEQCK